MKKQIIYMATGSLLLGASLTACNDLDTMPLSNYVTTEQKSLALSLNPGLASSGVVGIANTLNQFESVFSDNHADFGWPALMMTLDLIGPDEYSANSGYNWFSSSGEYSYGTIGNLANQMMWYYAYKAIRASNDVISSVPSDTEDPTLMISAAQGYVYRAYMYFTLAQGFQYTYVGHESLPCIPLLTDQNALQVANDGGCPRSTVEETYTQILNDLTTAINLLSKGEAAGKSVSDLAEIGSKRFASQAVAYGIRARVYLVMNKWKEAADDAQKAIALSGATPFSIAEASKPTFVTSDEHNWMWCVYIDASSRPVTTGICNWPSMMGSFSNGYATQVQVWKKISKTLFSTIPITDCRRGWFLDDKGQSKNITAAQKSYLTKCKAEPYTQVKFGPYEDQINTTTNANDWPLMRVEEMYLIQAEALGMSGDLPGGTKVLQDFVTKYRDPSYVCNAIGSEQFQDEVWRQRRIELWGEGFCYFDLLRLNKGLDRRGTGIDASWVYNVPAPLKPFLIPTMEMETNKLIGENNESWSKPNAVDDK